MSDEQTRDVEAELERFDLPEEVKARIRRIATLVLAANPEPGTATGPLYPE
jgi:hypothetical protein